jgi:golgi phosphoprotein 3
MKHLTLADEIIVLMLRDDTGAIKPARAASANIAIAGGLLMELALLGRIDTDLTSLFIVDPNPVGDELLDHVLREIAAQPVKQSSMWWINQLGVHGGDLSGTVLGRLVEAGILREEDRQFLWVLSRRAYPKNSGREEREAKRASCPLFSMTWCQLHATPFFSASRIRRAYWKTCSPRERWTKPRRALRKSSRWRR